ncbi:MAG: ATP-dependent zinc metalloprotease FtsH [Phycisphaerales bacterium]|nr:ATP-dependent zinc metalloprotease FtsH [Phycisphaerales bacterium]
MTDQNTPQRPSDQGPQGGPPRPPQRPASRGIMSWVFILGLLIVLFAVMQSAAPGVEIKSWQKFKELITPASGDLYEPTPGSPKAVMVKSDRVIATIKPGVEGVNPGKEPLTVYHVIDGGSRQYYLEQIDTLLHGNFETDTKQSVWVQLLFTIGPILLLLLIVWFLIARSVRGAGGGPGGMLGSFGKSKHRISTKETSKIRFTDVAGIDEAKDEVLELVEFLKNPKKFQRLGGRIPRGVLLVGPPGCGKTLLAKAIAGEADCPFFSISGSDFVEMFVGVGASRVRDLFKQAKENSPCIIFLDEIDAVGRRRGSGFSSGGHDEREQTLNAILVEMDGFEVTDQVIVIAATNRSDVLDPALIRPGRFDRQVPVSLPDVEGRLKILQVHSEGITLAPDVDLKRTARGTPMFSGADLAALINEAAIIATLEDKDAVDQHDLEEARDKIKFGRARHSRKIEETERAATAYHEAGHTVVQALLEDADPVHKVTIIPRGQAMGATFSLPEKDRYGYGRRYIEATLQVLCAGRIAEQRQTADVSSGAAMDIQMATAYARHMVLEWGMSDRLGFVRYAPSDASESFVPDKDYSPETARIIDEEVKRIVDTAYADAERLVAERWSTVAAIAEALLKYETLQNTEVETLMDGGTIDRPTVADLLDAEIDHASSDTPPPEQPQPDASTASDEDDGLMPAPA